MFLNNIPIIAVTGSSGKTTTKELIYSIMSNKFNVYKSIKSRNHPNDTKMHKKKIQRIHNAVVLEYGMSFKHFGKLHCKHIKPSIGVITNIGLTHLSKLGNTLMHVAQSKSGLIKYMDQSGLLFINSDDQSTNLLETQRFKGKIIRVGNNKFANYKSSNIIYTKTGMEFSVTKDNHTETFSIPVFGKHNVQNALFAIAVCHELNFSFDEIKAGLMNFRIPSQRLKLYKLSKNIQLLDDSYNSNPQALKAAIDVLINIGKSKKKIVILGSMLELGNQSKKLHKEIGTFLLNTDVNLILTLGRDARLISKNLSVKNGKPIFKHFKNRNDLHEFLNKHLKPNTIILVKGSFGMKMNKTSEYIKFNFPVYEVF